MTYYLYFSWLDGDESDIFATGGNSKPQDFGPIMTLSVKYNSFSVSGIPEKNYMLK